MTLEYRQITEDEYVPFFSAMMSTFGETPKLDIIEAIRPYFEWDRSVAAFEGSRIVGTSGIESFHMTLPGGGAVPVAGVTMVTVSPSHRRRGILTGMMDCMLRDAERRHESIAILFSSESLIYGRYGYGNATQSCDLKIARGHGALDRAPTLTGTVDLISGAEAATVLPGVYDRALPLYPGSITRNSGWWEIHFKDLEYWRRGYSDRRYAVYTSGSGSVDGYLAYRMKGDWDDGFPNGTLLTSDFITVTPEARAALFQFCMNVDLVATVVLNNVPLDDPLRWMAADSRRLRVSSTSDALWVRLLDVPSALTARRYSLEGRLRFEIVDPFRPANDGRYALEVTADGATCGRVRARPDLAMDVRDLGAVYLGGVTFSTLARAGRIVEHTAGSLRRADLMFSNDRDPWASTGF